MTAPILFLTNAFDARNSHEFVFSNEGNNQAVKNRLRVFDNQSLRQVYDQTIDSMKLSHLLPAKTLTNGTVYYAEVQTIDTQQKASPFSQKIIFPCYSEPVWNFLNLSENQIVRNSSFTVQIQYQQTEGEPLNSYQLILYDGLSREIFRTEKRYDTKNLSYPINNLDDKKAYFLQAVGETLNGMKVDTGLIPFTVSYTQPSIFALVELENIYEEGYVKISSNIITIEGKAEPSPPKFIQNQKVDLTEKGSSVSFEEGFSVDGDFTLQANLENPASNMVLMELTGKKGKVSVAYRQGVFDGQPEQAYFDLTAYNGLVSYYIVSNMIPVPASSDRLNVWVRKTGDLYEVKCQNMGVKV